MSGSERFPALMSFVKIMEEEMNRQEKMIDDLQAELAAARQEIERLKAEVAALAPADY